MALRRLNPTLARAITLTVCLFATTPTAAMSTSTYSNFTEFEALVNSQNGFATQKFRSSDILGPIFHVSTWDLPRADDSHFIFISSVYGEGNAGPMILDARDLSLVYADQRYSNSYHSDVQFIGGKPYFFFWEGTHSRGHANGNCLFFDENYTLVYSVTAIGRQGVGADMHDLRVTQDGNVVFSTFFNVPWDTTAVGGEANSWIMDSGFQEVDLVTNEVVFDWAASDHFKITDSIAPYTGGYGVSPDSGYDFAHINSIEKTPEGDYLISMRHLSLIALISGKDGHPIWTLGGKLNHFKDLSDGKATDFSWQHDARFHLGNTSQITMFDNHGEQTDRCASDDPKSCNTRGLHLELDYEAMTARVLQEYYHPDRINSAAMGGMTTLKNGNVFMGWGYNPSYTEFAPDGSTVLSFSRGIAPKHLPDMFAYRAYKGNWVGQPPWPPSIAIDRYTESTDNATVYLSWNGATEVSTWAIYASDDKRKVLNPANSIAMFNRHGFETTAPLVPSTHIPRRYLVATALDVYGQVLGSTAVVDMRDGSMVESGGSFSSAYQYVVEESKGFKTAAILLLVVMVLYCGSIVWRRRRGRGDIEKGWYKPIVKET